MIGFFRRIRKKLADDNQFLKYSRYAVGEIVLVVIGILIALQINNANQSRIEQLELKGYFNSISKNIESDLVKVNYINTKRKSLANKTGYIFSNLRPRIARGFSHYNKEDVSYASQTLIEISELNYLNANLSGFESLKNSGYLSKLQGTDIEDLLYRYYNLINEISLAEETYNTTLRNNNSELIRAELEGITSFFSPDWYEWDEEYIKWFHPRFRNILYHHSVFNLLRFPFHLIVKYENLRIIGTESVRMLKEKQLDLDESNTSNLVEVFDEYGTIGYPKIM